MLRSVGDFVVSAAKFVVRNSDAIVTASNTLNELSRRSTLPNDYQNNKIRNNNNGYGLSLGKASSFPPIGIPWWLAWEEAILSTISSFSSTAGILFLTTLTGDTKIDKKLNEKEDYYFHYTDEAGLSGIVATHKILPNRQGKVYLTKVSLNPKDAFNYLFLAQKTHQGRGNYLIMFRLSDYQKSQLQIDPSQPLELMYPLGTLKIQLGSMLYAGPNPF